MQIQAFGATAALAALSPTAAEMAPAVAAPKASYDALAILMHLGCM